MTLFFTLLGKIIPFYFSIILGYISTAFLACNKETIAKILLYILAPMIIFNATINIKFDLSVIFLPFFFFTLSVVIAFTALYCFKKIWNDNTSNVLAFTVATGNTGNLGIPIAILFLSHEMVDVFIFTVLASMLYQNTVGYYITAKGNFTAKQSIKKVLKLPILYAFLLGVIANINHIVIPDIFINYATFLKGCYAILGMMLLGMGLEHVKKDNGFDFKFISLALFVKFIVWPILVLIFIYLDQNYFLLLNEDLYKVMFIFSIVPLAGNTVTVATLLNVKPQKMSVTVFVSTLVSLVYIPLMIYFYGF